MSHHHYEPALEAELDYRRAKLQHGAEEHRLARLAGRATRAAAAAIIRPDRPARAGRRITGQARA